MFELGGSFFIQFWNDALSENFTQFDAPLVERVDVPNDSLRENRMLVKCNQFSECIGRQFLQWNRVRGTVSVECPMWNQLCGSSLGFDLLLRLAKRQCFALRENVGQQNVVMLTEWIE